MSTPRKVYLFLAIGLVAASQSGNIIRLGDAHPLAIAAWRLLFASILLAPIAGRSLLEVRKLTGRDWGLMVVAGVALATHFWAWIAAVQLTTVANASMGFAINPVITATAGYLFFRERVTKKLALSIFIGFLGVSVICWSDLSLDSDHLVGDGVALLCSALFTVYFLLGKKLRQKLPTTAYVTVLYGIAAVCCFATMWAMDIPAFNYSNQTWVCFLLMALIPTMIGHTSMNNAVKYISAGRISAATLVEPLLAGLVAAFVWNEAITIWSGIGYVLICTSVLVLVSEAQQKRV
jgi:RarD protein